MIEEEIFEKLRLRSEAAAVSFGFSMERKERME